MGWEVGGLGRKGELVEVLGRGEEVTEGVGVELRVERETQAELGRLSAWATLVSFALFLEKYRKQRMQIVYRKIKPMRTFVQVQTEESQLKSTSSSSAPSLRTRQTPPQTLIA